EVLAPLLLGALAAGGLEQNVELITSDAEVELEPGVTDLAVRPTMRPASTLRGSRVGRLRIGVYRAHKLRAGADDWVLPSARIRSRMSMPWLRAVPVDARGRVECDSLLTMRDACVVGLGRAVLPAFLTVNDSRLVRESHVEGGTPVWVLA